MATANDIATAIAVIGEVAGNPESGAIKELIDLLKSSATATNEVRVVEPKEKR
jgi:hypothetical protein